MSLALTLPPRDVCVRIVGSRQQREWNIRVSTFVLLHRVRGGTGCRIPIDLLTELEPVAESSGRKGEKEVVRGGRGGTEIGSNRMSERD